MAATAAKVRAAMVSQINLPLAGDSLTAKTLRIAACCGVEAPMSARALVGADSCLGGEAGLALRPDMVLPVEWARLWGGCCASAINSASRSSSLFRLGSRPASARDVTGSEADRSASPSAGAVAGGLLARGSSDRPWVAAPLSLACSARFKASISKLTGRLRRCRWLDCRQCGGPGRGSCRRNPGRAGGRDRRRSRRRGWHP